MARRRLVQLERFGGPEVMSWADGDLPDPGPDDVVIDVAAIGVNFGDTMVRRGEYRRDQPLSFTPGFEVAGRVVSGPRGGPRPGDRVVGFTEHGGGYADTVVVPSSHVFPVFDDVPLDVAGGLFTQGVTAWYAVERYGPVRPGDNVLIHGAAGGLGSLCVQLYRARGARVIASASSPERLERAAAHGATDLVLSDPQKLAAEVRELTGGRGVDVVVDGVGGPLFAPSMRALAMNGTYVVVGSATQQAAELDVRGLMPRGQTVVGFVVARVAELDAAEPTAGFVAVQRAWLDGTLRPEITTLPAVDVAEAHRRLEGRQATGKLVLVL
jgi:NADPH2:quinone reductase